MRLRRKTVFAASAGALAAALVAALGGLASLGGASLSARGAATAAPAAAAVQRATVMVHPDIQHVGRVEQQPPTTAYCEAGFHVACYEPGQVEQAYNLWPLYS